jgi:hypothetical protein
MESADFVINIIISEVSFPKLSTLLILINYIITNHFPTIPLYKTNSFNDIETTFIPQLIQLAIPEQIDVYTSNLLA